MAHLGPVAIAKLMREVGFVQPHAPLGTTPGFDPNAYKGDATVATGVAIALAESGGDTNRIHHNTDGSTDYGLWQINDKAHPDLFQHYNWRDPKQNTEMAKLVWQDAGGFSPWVTYKSGAYRKYEKQGTKGQHGAVNDYLKAQQPQNYIPSITPGWLKTILGLAPRIGLILLAVLLVIIGVIIMLESNSTARKLTETAALA